MTVRICFMNLSGRLIDAFLALEETRRFSTAAERCHVSASAFSQMIGRLEQSVGARLFDRDTRNVVLTAEGEVFAAGARRIASEMQTTVEDLRRRALLQTGRVAIAAPPSMAAAWLPSLFAAFRATHPGVALRLHDVVSDRCLDMIQRGEVDFGLNGQRGNDREFESQLLFNERFFVVCRHDDPLAGRMRVGMKDLRARELIHTVRTGSIWQQMLPLLRKAQAHDSGFEVAQFGTVAGLVAAGFGISIVPQFALPLCSRPGVVAVPFAARAALRPLYMIKRRERSLAVAADHLWESIKEDCARGGPSTVHARI
jgi:LysR family carnitine catabolism transcriptional activator